MDAKELLDFLVQGLPPGLSDSWDLQPNPADPDFYEELYALAQGVKWAVTDRIERLRAERNPATAVEKLEDYELALGLLQTRTGQFGTIAQRQGQVVGRFRESGGLTKFAIRTVMQSYLRYADPADILVIEADRAATKAVHTYAFTAPLVLTGVTNLTVNVPDDSYVSDGGVQLRIGVETIGAPTAPVIEITGPDGFKHRWDIAYYESLGVVVGANTVFDLELRAQDFAPRLADDGYTWVRRRINGTWTLTLRNLDKLNFAGLFVEGVGRNSAGQDGRGYALFEWGVLAETAKLGAGADLLGAAEAVRRMDHCHLNGHLLLDGHDITSLAAIPDDPNAIPDEGIPG